MISPEEFEAVVERLIDEVGNVIEGNPAGAVETALATLLFGACDTDEELTDLIDMLNEMVDMTRGEISGGVEWVH